MTNAKKLFNNFLTFYNNYYNTYLLSNPRFHLSNDEKLLSWYSYTTKESFYDYLEYYEWVNDNLQYSIAIEDKAFIQIYYEEIDKVIKKASLSFLPHPDSMMTYFRFDMDVVNNKDYYHNSYHINFGYNSQNIRFSLNKFPYPSEFLKFILFLLGNEEFKDYNANNFFNSLDSLGEKYSHLFDFTCRI